MSGECLYFSRRKEAQIALIPEWIECVKSHSASLEEFSASLEEFARVDLRMQITPSSPADSSSFKLTHMHWNFENASTFRNVLLLVWKCC